MSVCLVNVCVFIFVLTPLAKFSLDFLGASPDMHSVEVEHPLTS